MYNLNIVGLLQQFAQAQIIRPYKAGENQIKETSSNYREVEIEQVESDLYSFLGAPILMPVKILGGRYPQRLDDGTISYINYPEYTMPFSMTFSVEMPKRIKKEEVAGLDGTFKEYINFDDLKISFKGLLINNRDDYPPIVELQDLKRIIKVPQAVDVECEFFDWLGINSIVFENLKISQIPGASHYVGFEIFALSDKVTEARLIDGL